MQRPGADPRRSDRADGSGPFAWFCPGQGGDAGVRGTDLQPLSGHAWRARAPSRPGAVALGATARYLAGSAAHKTNAQVTRVVGRVSGDDRWRARGTAIASATVGTSAEYRCAGI